MKEYKKMEVIVEIEQHTHFWLNFASFIDDLDKIFFYGKTSRCSTQSDGR